MRANNTFSEEQIAAYLDGKGGINDMDFLNAVVQDDALFEELETIEQIDDLDSIEDIDELNRIH